MANRDTFPFNTSIGTAQRDARSIEETLRNAKKLHPNEWHAFKISKYWDGQVTAAVVGPDNLTFETLVHVFQNGSRQALGQTVFGIAIPYLLASDANEIELHFNDQSIVVPLVPATL